MSLRARRACLHARVPLHLGAFVQEGVTARRRDNPPHPMHHVGCMTVLNLTWFRALSPPRG
jgi:hypothetical protein